MGIAWAWRMALRSWRARAAVQALTLNAGSALLITSIALRNEPNGELIAGKLIHAPAHELTRQALDVLLFIQRQFDGRSREVDC